VVRAPDLDHILAALADPTRRGVIDLLREGPRRAGELAHELDVTPPALSRHLRVLRARGLVEDLRPEEDARVRVFRLRREPFDALQSWLERVESFWTDQLGSFKAHAERGARRKRR
jgi:DNA-binding transcriptional ArsR family regulator